MSRIVVTGLTIAASGSPGTTPQYSASQQLPDMGPIDVGACQVALSDLTGGTSPTVTASLQVSPDNTNWSDLPGLNPSGGLALSANGNGLLDASGDSLIANLAPWRYVRLKGVGGGTAAPTAWSLSASLSLARA